MNLIFLPSSVNVMGFSILEQQPSVLKYFLAYFPYLYFADYVSLCPPTTKISLGITMQGSSTTALHEVSVDLVMTGRIVHIHQTFVMFVVAFPLEKLDE